MFRQVAAERIAKLNLLWIEIERRAGDPAAFLREAHTLKGEASLTGFARVTKLVHALEDHVKLVRDRGGLPTAGDGDLLLSGLELTLKLTQGAPAAASGEADAFVAQVASARGTPPPVVGAPSAPPAALLVEAAGEVGAGEVGDKPEAGQATARMEGSITGAGCTMAPALTGIIAIGTLSSCITTGLSIPVTGQTSGVLVVSATAAGLSLVNTFTGYASASLAVA